MRARVAAGERLTGALVRMPCEEIVEMLAVAGLDFVLIDCEHGPADVGMLRTHIAFADAHDLPVLVRPGEDEHHLAQRALDQGARGIVAPHVEDVAQATALAGALRYPPHGTRGFATYPRAGRFGSVTPDEHRASADDVLVLAMLESPGAISRAGEIVGVDGIDGYLVGVADLGASRTDADPTVAELLASVNGDPAVHGSAGTAGAPAPERGAAGDSERGSGQGSERGTVRDSGRGAVRADLAGSAEAAAQSFADGAQLVAYNLTAVMMASFRGLAAAKD
ncbi:2,4-dihydroxyhept-2-ene-1,7-dioic acid aldolase [Pseudonocardia sp. Ae168_Ps1]|uniref:HpcH/HpaI aldolase family protein n=1 Tax=unclassified Pseudonocardia TaxID=2619320 RepID=UPI00094B27B1|nr:MULTISPECIES: aldolase/citrate lyase family protein [unclassified Pseudonocardia]OLL70988.1 2,4-dihydroxyhept-2-ene-1,7-dioic acid aldolase [Pseudonocardia sp. Ae168_Ps1]OLL77461.1 2,4-dihydroxyhept-2-ene-1,7-dioic acid aldolase [Pseudonocardia sp. Ae150A_Ps1]OLL88426.1 2,4-dihydroxyhept-2-ene-1,7-dioic acid aldolase [Pseudonocardia sp. Ae263_Ps1]OLL91551.1 2,4-dihydroxyhept-2-ene-1,7-dioic acid aldolase [Pseudonocardia sp. Ae356_Ps1]